MSYKNSFGFIQISLILLVIVLGVYDCAGDSGDSETMPKNADSESRAISPKKEYTKDSPAEWEGIADDHLPEVVFEEKKSKDNIKVKVTGRKFSERHYIEVIGIMDEKSADIDTKYLRRSENPNVTLSLNPKEYDPEKIKVFVKCNLHDLWTTPLLKAPQ